MFQKRRRGRVCNLLTCWGWCGGVLRFQKDFIVKQCWHVNCSINSKTDFKELNRLCRNREFWNSLKKDFMRARICCEIRGIESTSWKEGRLQRFATHRKMLQLNGAANKLLKSPAKLPDL
jgi:hypothetical protein